MGFKTRGVALTALCGICCGGTAAADILIDTGLGGGMFGFVGYDISTEQSVALAFTPSADYTLDEVGVWIMSNDFANPGRTFTLSIRENIAGSLEGVPSPTALESWNIATTAVGWNPVLEVATSALNPTLSAGSQYWIVAESTELAQENPVWVQGSSFDPEVAALKNTLSGPDWFSGIYQGSAPGGYVAGTPVPSPAGLAVFGLAGAASVRRRRR